MKTKVSVVVPIYNTEKYLRQCIQSIIDQTYTDFELILINDGSTDYSGQICDKFAEYDRRIRVYHKKNAGVSAARNLGIEKATGDWITFIDSDDFVANKFLNSFMSNDISATSLVIQGINRYDNEISVFYEFPKKIVTKTSEFLNNFQIIPYFFGPVSKIYKRDIIIDYNLRFDVSKSYAEDTLFNLDYLFYCNKDIILLNENNYFYRNTVESLSTKKLNFLERKVLFEDFKEKLGKLTTNRQHFYWYSVELIRSLYKDHAVVDKRTNLEYILKKHKSAILVSYEKNDIISVIITLLIKTNNIFLLNQFFKKAIA